MATRTTEKHWGNEQNVSRLVTEEQTQMISKYMKRISNSLVIGEINTKFRMSYHFTPTRLAKIKSSFNDSKH